MKWLIFYYEMCTLQKVGGEDSKGRRVLWMPERPHSHPWSWIWWQLPLLPKLPSIFQRDPTLGVESDGNYPYYPNHSLFLKRPLPHSVFILCAWYTIWVSIPIKSLVLSLFLAFTTLSDLYYLHHPPSEGCTFRSQKKGILYIQPNGSSSWECSP